MNEERLKENPVLTLAYSYRKERRGLTSPSDGQIAINNTYALTANVLRRYWRMERIKVLYDIYGEMSYR